MTYITVTWTTTDRDVACRCSGRGFATTCLVQQGQSSTADQAKLFVQLPSAALQYVIGLSDIKQAHNEQHSLFILPATQCPLTVVAGHHTRKRAPAEPPQAWSGHWQLHCWCPATSCKSTGAMSQHTCRASVSEMVWRAPAAALVFCYKS